MTNKPQEVTKLKPMKLTILIITTFTASFIAGCSRYEYHAIISDRGTEIWSRNHKFVDFIPYDSTSAWDKVMTEDNQ